MCSYAVCSCAVCSDISCSLTPLSLIPSVPYRAEQTRADSTTQSVRGNLNDNRGDSMWFLFNGPVHLFYTPSTTRPLMDLWPSESLPLPSIDNSKSSSICQETLETPPHPRWTIQVTELNGPFPSTSQRLVKLHVIGIRVVCCCQHTTLTCKSNINNTHNIHTTTLNIHIHNKQKQRKY